MEPNRERGYRRRIAELERQLRERDERIAALEPTNNLAEQAMRFVVIDRRITQGTRSERGRQWSERIWTGIATCAQQGRSVFEYLRQAITAYLRHQPIPS